MPERVGYEHWYWLERWRRRSRAQLRAHPLCAMCLQRSIPVVATVCDHVEPHRGDWNSFITGKVQSLCKSCHDGRKRIIEQRGYAPDIGEDGWPLDPQHPAWRGTRRTGSGIWKNGKLIGMR